MKNLKDNENYIEYNGFLISYGRIPSNIIDGWEGIVFYFTTNERELFNDIKKYEETIQPLIDQIRWQNDESEHGVTWRETRKEAIVWDELRQITLVSFRVRDTY